MRQTLRAARAMTGWAPALTEEGNKRARGGFILPPATAAKTEAAMKNILLLSTAAALAATAVPAAAQSGSVTPDEQRTTARERLAAIFGSLFGDRTGGSGNLDAEWALGRTPLGAQRVQFDARVDAEVRSGALTSPTAQRLKAEYSDLVTLEARYGYDRRFSSSERAELATRYRDLTDVLDQGDFDDANDNARVAVAGGQVEFNRRVDAAFADRRLNRAAATRLRADYAALVRIERGYLADSRLTSAERDDLETRLDALDARLGDTGYGGAVTARSRLDAIARALPSSGLSAATQAQLRVEHEDLSRLENAYARLNVSADERAYLDKRLANLEMRARR
jgi:hypothetical protein